MRSSWRGTYKNGKWHSPARVEPFGTQELLLRYAYAVIDSGSPITVLPGICPAPGDEPPDDAVTVHIPAGANEWIEAKLAPRGRIFRFGGIGGAKLDRFVFLADLHVDGLAFPDLAPVTFFNPEDLQRPIISISPIADAGGRVEFGSRGIRMRNA